MKKVNNSLHLIFLVFLLISALSLVACEFFPTNEECSHESTEWVIDKNPTCTETGARHKVCTLCETTVATETIDKAKHVEKLIPAVDATCTESGLTAGKKCANCDTVLVAQQTVPAKQHVEVIIKGTNPTCTATGLSDGKSCSVCKAVILKQEELSMLDHVAGDWIVDKSAAVGVEGQQHKECIGCGKIMQSEVIPPLAETHVHEGITWNVVVPATCQTPGTKNLVCSCGKTMDTASIDILPHTEEILPAVASTCMSTGLTAGKKCSACGEVLVKQSVTAISSHKEELVLGVAATCTATGLTNGKKCSVCTTITLAQQIIPATGHSFDGGACKDCGISEPYGVWIVDGQGNPITDVIVKIMKDGEMISMHSYKGEFLPLPLDVGSYQIELDLSQIRTKYTYDESLCVLTPEKRTTTIRLFKTVGKRTSLYVGEPISRNYIAYVVNEGATQVDLTVGDYSFFVFEPTVAAIYTFTYECDADLTVSYHGSDFFTQGRDLTNDSSDAARYENGISISVYASNIGGSYVIGIKSSSATSCILNIRNAGDPGTRIEDEPWTPYLEDESKVAADLAVDKSGTYTAIDLTDLSINAVYNKNDGYYHLGTADGPIIFIDLTSSTSYVSSIQAICGNQRMGEYVYDMNGKVIEKRSYNELFHQYGMPSSADATVDEPVRVPLTAKLAEAIQSFGDKNGWWSETSESNIFTQALLGAPYNREFAWLLFCGYYN